MPSVVMRTDIEVSPLFALVFVMLSSRPSISEEQAANDSTIKIAEMIFFAFIGMNVFLRIKILPLRLQCKCTATANSGR